MKMLVPFALVLMISTTSIAEPAEPAYPGDDSRVFWFLVMSDQHITARDSDGPERLEWLLTDCMDIVEPDIIFNMGDLTDASKGEPLVSVHPGQQDEEWQLYRQILDDTGITVDRYIDLPGNHDQYSERGLDHYLQYSLAGTTFGRTQHSVVIDKPWGSYHFMGIDTAGNDGAGFPFDNAGLDLGELMEIQGALQDNTQARLTLMFGHHPIVRPDLGFKLGEGSDEIQDLMGDFNVRAYFYGHTHEYRDLYWPDNERMPTTLHENVDSFGKADENQLLLVSVDNDNLHIRQVSIQEWPWVIITTPSDSRQGESNPWAFDVPAGLESAPVRALGFTADPFLSCDFRVDDLGWHAMAPLGNHLFQASMDTRNMAQGSHSLEVRCMPGPSTGHRIRFNVVAYTCGNGIDEDEDGLTDWPDDPGCDSVLDSDEYNEPIVIVDDVEPTPDVLEDIVEDAGQDATSPDDVTADVAQPGEDSSPPVDVLEEIGSNDVSVSDAGRDVVADIGPGADLEIDDVDEGNEGDDTTAVKGGGCASASGTADPGLLPAMCLLTLAILAIFRSRRRAS